MPCTKKVSRIGCGIFGAINFDNQPVFSYVYWGLRAENHRGHQSHGFLTYNEGKFYTYKSLDLVPKLKTSAIQEWFGRLARQHRHRQRQVHNQRQNRRQINRSRHATHDSRGKRHQNRGLLQRQHRQHAASPQRGYGALLRLHMQLRLRPREQQAPHRT